MTNTDLERTAREMADQHERSYEAREARYRREADEIAKGNRGGGSNSTLGQLKMEIPTGVAREWIAREGKDIIHDKGWKSYMQRKHPELFPNG